MDTQTKLKTTAAAATMLLLLYGVTAKADDTAPKGDVPILYLGKLPITGQQQIVDTLVAIKAALKETLSDAADKADKVVCRINNGTGSMFEYLYGSSNRDSSLPYQ